MFIVLTLLQTTGECLAVIRVFQEYGPISSVDIMDISCESVGVDSAKKVVGLLLVMGRSGKGKTLKLSWV